MLFRSETTPATEAATTTKVKKKKRKVSSEPNRLQLQAMRIAALSELHWFSKKNLEPEEVVDLMGRLLVSMDWPDGFWKKQTNVEIGSWVLFLCTESVYDKVRRQFELGVGDEIGGKDYRAICIDDLLEDVGLIKKYRRQK